MHCAGGVPWFVPRACLVQSGADSPRIPSHSQSYPLLVLHYRYACASFLFLSLVTPPLPRQANAAESESQASDLQARLRIAEDKATVLEQRLQARRR